MPKERPACLAGEEIRVLRATIGARRAPFITKKISQIELGRRRPLRSRSSRPWVRRRRWLLCRARWSWCGF